MLCKAGQLEDRIAIVKVNDSECFLAVRKRSKVKAYGTFSNIIIINSFKVLKDGVRDEPSLMLVANSLVRHQDKNSVERKKPKQESFCYP